jgi:hypothetical protein
MHTCPCSRVRRQAPETYIVQGSAKLTSAEGEAPVLSGLGGRITYAKRGGFAVRDVVLVLELEMAAPIDVNVVEVSLLA